MKEVYRKSFIMRLVLFPISILLTILDLILLVIIFLVGDIDELFVGTARLKKSFIYDMAKKLKEKEENEKLQEEVK